MNLLNFKKKIRIQLNRIGLKNKSFTIISNNCWGGFIYQRFGLKYNTPFIGLYMFAPDYIKMLEDFEKIINNPLIFIEHKDSRYKTQLKEKNLFDTYPIGILGENIEIHFLHYSSKTEALEKWNKRVKRINFENMLIKFSDRDLCTEELIQRFDKLNFSNKICFCSREYKDLPSVVYIKEFKDKIEVEEEWRFDKRYIDIKHKINKMYSKN